MTDTLLFLHLLSAAALFAAVFVFSAVALGAPAMEPGGVGSLRSASGAPACSAVFVFGVALGARHRRQRALGRRGS